MTKDRQQPKTWAIPKFDDKHANAELRKKPGEWFWVRMPTSMDSLTRKRLMLTRDGRDAFAVYIHIVEVTAKDPPRGVLADERGVITIEDLSLKTAIPVAAIKKAIKILSDPGIAWLCESHCGGIENPTDSGKSKLHSNSSSNSDSQGGAGGSEPDADFDRFWTAYPPPKSDMPAARAAWDAAVDKPPIDELLRRLDVLKRSRRWTNEGGKYIPKPANWLDAQGWNDEAEPAASATPDPEADTRDAARRQQERDQMLAERVSPEERRQLVAVLRSKSKHPKAQPVNGGNA